MQDTVGLTLNASLDDIKQLQKIYQEPDHVKNINLINWSWAITDEEYDEYFKVAMEILNDFDSIAINLALQESPQ